MKFVHIDEEKDISQLTNNIHQNKDIFMLIYMDGCGPCNQVRPEWQKLKNVLHKYKKNPRYKNVVIVDINKDILEKAKTNIKSPLGFPTITFVSKKGSVQENFEESSCPNKNREIDAFVSWIETKLPKRGGTRRKRKYSRFNKSKKNKSFNYQKSNRHKMK